MPPPLAALLAAANTASSIGNTISQGIQNRKNRRWAEKRYNIERADALHDWHMQNAYNSPEQQMQRLKAAGLNPHLVYGNGANAMSSQGVDSTKTSSVDTTAPQFDPASLSAFHDLSLKQAQTNNLEAGLKTAEEQQKLLSAQTLSTLMATKTAELDYATKKELQQYQFEAAKLANKKTDAEITNTLIKNHIESFTANFMQETQQKRIDLVTAELLQKNLGMKLTQEQMKIIQQDQQLKDIEIAIRKKGGNPNDPAYQKYIVGILVALVKKLGYDMTELIK